MSDKGDSMLGVEVAGQRWLVAAADVGEALPVPTLTPVPLAKSWLRGVANVHGELYCVADLAAYLRLGDASGEHENRVLVLADRQAHAALLVERVLGLYQTAGWTRSEAEGQAVCRDEEGMSWRMLDVPGLLAQPEFLDIGIEDA